MSQTRPSALNESRLFAHVSHSSEVYYSMHGFCIPLHVCARASSVLMHWLHCGASLTRPVPIHPYHQPYPYHPYHPIPCHTITAQCLHGSLTTPAHTQPPHSRRDGHMHPELRLAPYQRTENGSVAHSDAIAARSAEGCGVVVPLRTIHARIG